MSGVRCVGEENGEVTTTSSRLISCFGYYTDIKVSTRLTLRRRATTKPTSKDVVKTTSGDTIRIIPYGPVDLDVISITLRPHLGTKITRSGFEDEGPVDSISFLSTFLIRVQNT